MPNPTDELVTVGNYWSPVEAHLARNQLEAAGIRVALTDEHTATMNWDLSNAIRGIKLQVLSSDAERADAILNSLDGAGESQPDDPEILAGFEEETQHEPETHDDPSPVTEDEKPEAAWNEREKLADRVYRGAVFGLLLWPMQLWVFVLLVRLYLSDEPLRPEMRRKAIIGGCINLMMVALTGYFVRYWLWLMFA